MRQTFPAPLLRVSSAALLVAGLIAGCSFDDRASTDNAASADSDASTAQPFDALRGEELGILRHSIRKLRNECLAEAGYPQNLTHMAQEPDDDFDHLRFDLRTFGPVDEQEARRSGFGKDAPAQIARIVSFDANYDQEVERCELAASKKIGPEAQELSVSYGELGNTLMGEFGKEYERLIGPQLSELRTSLRDCLAEAGFQAEDPEDFAREPYPEKLGVRFGAHETIVEEAWSPERKEGTIQIGPAIPAKKYVPTEEEVELAVAWSKCTQRLEFKERLMPLVISAQQTVYERHEEQLAEHADKTVDLAKKAADLKW